MIKLGILEADTLYDDLRGDYGSYGKMFAQLFQRLGYQFEYHFFEVQQGQVPSALACDAYLLTGSKAGVYDDLPWLEPLAEWVKAAFARQEKVAGICFGHQFLAHHLGGQAGLSDKGWGIGLHRTELQSAPEWLNASPSKDLTLLYSHQDQVHQLPPSATRLLRSDFCPNAAFYIDQQVLAFQGHPEFTAEYLTRLLSQRSHQLDAPLLAQKLAELQPDPVTDSAVVGHWLAQFFQQEKA